jgi:hypothetical protein
MYRYQQLVSDMSRPTSMTKPSSGRSYLPGTYDHVVPRLPMAVGENRTRDQKGLSTVIRFTYFMFGMDNHGHGYHKIYDPYYILLLLL